MKKLLFLFVLFMMSIGLFSQVSKGSKLVGVSLGSISFTSSNSETTYSNTATVYNSDGNSFSVSLNPNYAWFIQDNVALGGSVSVSFYNSKSTSSNSASTNTTESKYNQPSIYVGPMLRYYFGGSEKGMPFAQFNGQIGISGGKSTSTSTSSSSETTYKPKGDWNVGIQLGYEHFISEYVGCYASVGVNYGKSKTSYEYRPSTGTGYDYTSSYSRFYIPVNFGLQVHLPSKASK